MATYGYSIPVGANDAHAVLRDAPISYKVAVLIGKAIKGKTAKKAIAYLEAVQNKTRAIPYTKFSDSVGHRPGKVGPGRYPQKASALFEALIKNAVTNADDKGIGTDVTIAYVVAQRASLPMHSGRQGRRQFKRAHVELVVSATQTAPKAAKRKVEVAA